MTSGVHGPVHLHSEKGRSIVKARTVSVFFLKLTCQVFDCGRWYFGRFKPSEGEQNTLDRRRSWFTPLLSDPLAIFSCITQNVYSCRTYDRNAPPRFVVFHYKMCKQPNHSHIHLRVCLNGKEKVCDPECFLQADSGNQVQAARYIWARKRNVIALSLRI